MDESGDRESGERTYSVCASTDTLSGEPCQRQVGHPDAECHDHRGPGAPFGNRNAVGHGAPEENQNALKNDGGPPKGNTNALTHGKHIAPDKLRETFTSEERAMHSALLRDYQDGERALSEEQSERMATAVVMEDRLSLKLIEDGLNQPRVADALLSRGRELEEIEEEVREERESRKEQQTRRYVEILAGLPPGGFDELDHEREPPSEESESEDPTTDIEREVVYERITPNPNMTLAQTAIADGGRLPSEDSAEGEEGECDGDEADSDSEDGDGGGFVHHRYTSAENLVR